MQKVGDICDNCRPKWEKKKVEPRVLQRLGETESGAVVPACTYCDGEFVFEIAQANDK